MTNVGLVYALLEPVNATSHPRAWRQAAARSFIRRVTSVFTGQVVFLNQSPTQVKNETSPEHWMDLLIFGARLALCAVNAKRVIANRSNGALQRRDR